MRRLGNGSANETTVLIDTAPELRSQTASAGAKRLDAILLTHSHADQTHGIDDIRAFFISQGERIPTYADAATASAMMQRFGYVFEGAHGYPAMAEQRPLPNHGLEWRLDGPSGAIPVTTFDQNHGDVRSVGYRFGGVAYSSDVVALDDVALGALSDLDVWIVDALRWQPHPSHAHVERALSWIAQVRPRRAILTNLYIDLDFAELTTRLPKGVEAGFDGLRFIHYLGAPEG